MTAERLLAWLLRLGAVLTLPAFATALLPAAHAGLPGWWVAAEGPPVIGVGVLLLALVRAASR